MSGLWQFNGERIFGKLGEEPAKFGIGVVLNKAILPVHVNRQTTLKKMALNSSR